MSKCVTFDVEKFIEKLCSSEYESIEFLFTNRFEDGSLLKPIYDIKDIFLTKSLLFNIQRCAFDGIYNELKNYNEKLLDKYNFMYTFKGNGSTNVINWMKCRGLKFEHCGVAKIDNMDNMFCVYYDWGGHIMNNPNWDSDSNFIESLMEHFDVDWEREAINIASRIQSNGYNGVINAETNKLSLIDCILEKSKPLMFMYYDERKYVEYTKNNNCNTKKLVEYLKMVHIGKKVAKYFVFETNINEAEATLFNDIINSKYTKNELCEIIAKEEAEFNEVLTNTKLKDNVDVNFVNNILINITQKEISK